MKKSTKDFSWEKEKRSYERIYRGITGQKTSIKSIPAGSFELAFTDEKGDIYMTKEHPLMDGLSEYEKKTFRMGIFAHETLHQIFSDFEILINTQDKLSKYERTVYAALFNLIEDPHIEWRASQVMGDSLLKALKFSIRHLYTSSPDINESTPGFIQYKNALVILGDGGFLRGHITDPIVAKILKETAPIFCRAITEIDAKKRSDAALELMELTRPLWEIEEKIDELMKELVEEAKKHKKEHSSKKHKEKKEEFDKEPPMPREELLKLLEEMKEKGEIPELEEDEGSDIDFPTGDDGSEDEDSLPMPSKKMSDSDSDKEDFCDDCSSDEESKSGASSKSEESSSSNTSDSDTDDEDDGFKMSDEASSDVDTDTEEYEEDGFSMSGKKSSESEDSDESSSCSSPSKDSDDSSSPDTDTDVDKPEEATSSSDEYKTSSDESNETSSSSDDESENDDSFSADKENDEIEDAASITDSSEDTSSSDSESSIEELLDGINSLLDGMETSIDEESVTITDEDIQWMDEMDKVSENQLEEEQQKEETTDFDDTVIQTMYAPNEYSIHNVNVSIEPSSSAVEYYNDFVNNNSRSITAFVKRLQRIFANDADETERKKSGRVNIKRMMDSKVTARIFDKRITPKNIRNLGVCIALDESGSMGCPINHESILTRSDLTRQCAIFLAEALAKLNIPTYIMGYSADECGKGDWSEDGYNAVHYHYVKWKNTIKERLSLLGISAKCNNFDGISINYASETLNKHSSAYKLLVIISDGEPYSLSSRGEQGIVDAKEAIRKAKKTASVLGIAVGDDCTDTLHAMYGKDFIHINSLEGSYVKIAAKIEKLIKSW